MFKFFRLTDSYAAQIEAWAIVCLRIGFAAWGVAPVSWHTRKRRPWWTPHVHLTIGSHTGQCGQQWIFRLCIGRTSVGWRTRGDATPNLASYANRGLWLRLFGRHVLPWWAAILLMVAVGCVAEPKVHLAKSQSIGEAGGPQIIAEAMPRIVVADGGDSPQDAPAPPPPSDYPDDGNLYVRVFETKTFWEWCELQAISGAFDLPDTHEVRNGKLFNQQTNQEVFGAGSWAAISLAKCYPCLSGTDGNSIMVPVAIWRAWQASQGDEEPPVEDADEPPPA